AIESTGVYWIALCQKLEAAGIEGYLVNAPHVRHVPGRKTDVKDCQWLQRLHSFGFGLLSASFRPSSADCEVCNAIGSIRGCGAQIRGERPRDYQYSARVCRCFWLSLKPKPSYPLAPTTTLPLLGHQAKAVCKRGQW